MALDPVDIDIRMKQNVTEESARASVSMSELSRSVASDTNAIDRVLGKLGYSVGEATEKSLQELRRQVRESKAAIKEMESLVKKLPDVAKKQTGYQNQETLRELEAVKKALSEEKVILSDLETRLEAAGEASKRLVTRKNELREQMARLKIEGKENTEEYRRMAEEVGVLEGALVETGKQMKLLGQNDGLFQGVLSGLSGVSGALAAGAGAAALMGEKSEDLEKVQTRLQALMAITIGLQQTYNTLQTASAFRTIAVAKAKQAWTASLVALNTQLGISAGLSKVLMVSGIGLLIGGVAALIALYKNMRSERKLLNEAESEAVKNASAEIIRANTLASALRNSNNTYEVRQSALTKLRELMPGYNAMLDKEGNLIEDNTGALKKYVEQLKAASLVKAYTDRLSKSQTDYDDFLFSFSEGTRRIIEARVAGDFTDNLGGSESMRIHYEKALEYKEDIDRWQKKVEEFTTKELSAGAPQEGTKDYWEQQRKNAQSLLETMTDAEKGSKKWSDVVAEYNKATEKLKNWDISAEKKERAASETDVRKAREKLIETEVREQIALDAILLEAMEEGAAKRLKQADNERDKELERIRAQRRKIEELETKAASDGRYSDANKAHAANLKSSLDAEEKAAIERYEATVERIKKASQKAVDDVWEGVYGEFKSELEKELGAIEKNYRKRGEVIEREVTLQLQKEIQLHSLAAAKENALNVARSRSLLRILDAEEDIAVERQKLANRHVLLEADKEKKLLQIALEYARKRMAVLRALQSLETEGVEEEIMRLEVIIETLTADIAKASEAKISECVKGIKALSTALSSLPGAAGDFFSSLSGEIDNIVTALSSTATPVERLSSLLTGVSSIIGMIASASDARHEKEKEFYRNAIALAHEYALALNEQLRIYSSLNSGGGFINDYAGRINDGFAAMTDAIGNYRKALEELADGKAKVDLRNAVDWSSVGIGMGAGAAIGSLIVPVIGTIVGGIIGGIVGLFGGKKKKDVFAGLLEVFPELVDGAGNLNKELAQTLINTSQVDDETKQLLQNAIEWAEAVEAANEQIKDIAVELAGDLGSNLRQAIVEAWKAGEDAAGAMFDAASNSLEHFVENMLYSLLFSDVFSEFSDRLAASLNPNGGDGDILDDFDWLMKNMDERNEAYISGMEAFKKRAKESGYDLWNDDKGEEEETRTGLSRGAEGITEDTAGKIEGGIYALRITANNMENLMREGRDVANAIFSLAERITENTEYCRFLKDINDTLTDMQLRGVLMR